MGNHTVSCKKRIQGNGRGDKYEIFSYLFQKEQCIDCPHRDICIGKSKKKARTLRVAANAPIYYEISQEQKKPEFKEKYKKRSAQEWKNGEMKRFHGMSRARGWGLRSILFQAKLTAIAVNLKRIAAITGGNPAPVTDFIKTFPQFECLFEQVFKIFSQYRFPISQSA